MQESVLALSQHEHLLVCMAARGNSSSANRDETARRQGASRAFKSRKLLDLRESAVDDLLFQAKV